MRVIVGAVLVVAACGGGGASGEDASGEDASGGDASGECTVPTEGRYAISDSIGQTKLYRLGEGPDGWDADLGVLEYEGTPLPFQTITSKADVVYGSSNGATYRIDVEHATPGHVPVTLEVIYSPNFTAYSADPDAIAAEGRSIYCLGGGEAVGQGLAITGAFTEILAMSGSCEPVPQGPLTAIVYAWSGTATHRISVHRDGDSPDLALIDESPDLPKITGAHFGEGADLVVTEDGQIGHVESGIFTAERVTRLCDELSPGLRVRLSGMD